MATRTIERIWHFDVTDPTLHPNGFTIYKVTCKVFQVHSPESMTEVVVWKRYNDFKELFRSTMSIHKSLHRREEFPKFAKPKLFGRFEEGVIEERRQSAERLLHFIGSQSHLYKSKVFQEFIKDGKIKQGFSGNLLKPSKLDILATDKVMPPSVENNSQPAEQLLKPVKHPTDEDQDIKETDSTEEQGENSEQSDSKMEQLEGVWNFPQIPDSISLNSYDDSDDVDIESTLSTSLPDTDLTYFDPLMADDKQEGTHDLHTSSSWLFAAMNTCADMDAEDEKSEGVSSPAEGGIQINFEEKMDIPSIQFGTDKEKTKKEFFVSSVSSAATDVSEFDPLYTRKDSKVECGKGDLDLSSAASVGSSSLNTSRSSSAASSPRHQSTRSPMRMRSQTGESVSTMDLGGKEDYIYIAANQICLAQEHEANGRYELAFSCYKNGVGILLQGVQDDKNKSRRDAVRRKTAQYLIKAEDLYNRHLAKDSLDGNRWATDTDLSPMAEIDPSLSMLKGPVSELKNYKVLGTVDKVLLVMDKTTDETYVIKTIHKSSVCSRKLRTILPTSCPYMVNLHKFYETDSSIYLLLQHATGGKLWTYIGAYLQSGKQKDNFPGLQNDKDRNHNVYSGQKIHVSEEPNFEGNQPDRNVGERDKSVIHVDRDSNVHFVNKDNDFIEISQENDTQQCEKKFSENYHQIQDINASENNDTVKDLSTNRKSVGSKLVHRQSTCSISSAEDLADFSASDQSAQRLSLDNTEFTNVLQEKSNSALQFFSINSIDSTDDAQQERQDSAKSLSDIIDCIVEESEVSPAHRIKSSEATPTHHQKSNWTDSEVFLEDWSKGDNSSSQPDIKDNEAEEIVKNAKELIRSVEKTLSQTDAEVEAAIYPQKLSDVDSDNTSNNDNTTTGKVSESTSALTVSGLSKGQGSSCDTLVDEQSDSGNETSIYDLNRSNDEESSPDVSISEKTNDVNKPSQQGDTIVNGAVGRDRENTLVKSRTDTGTSSHLSDISGKDSRSSTITDNKPTKTHTPPAKLPLVRLSSKELSRSASMERELTSPLKSRGRTVSVVFQQLDLAASSPEQVKLPESCIRQWAAEMVVAVSRLHAEGILCRDLKPDNILLGERGHILLTYFCQLSTTDKELDFDAVDQLYIAPEVRGISGHTAACDWWSIGALLFELIIGRSLHSCHLGGITSHTQLYIPENISSEARGLLQQLLCFNPRERLGAGINGAEEIKAHPFFYGIDWNSLES